MSNEQAQDNLDPNVRVQYQSVLAELMAYFHTNEQVQDNLDPNVRVQYQSVLAELETFFPPGNNLIMLF